MRTRVAIDVGPVQGARTGVGLAVDRLIEALTALDDGPELLPYVLSFRSRPGPGVRRLPYPAALAHRAWCRASWPPADRFLAPAELVHGTNYVVPPSRLPRLVTVYDCWFLEHPAEVHPDVRRAGEVLRRAVRKGAVVHATSHATAAKVGELLATDRIEVIHLGSPPAVPEVEPRSGDRGPGGRHPGQGPFVLSIGTVERRKNVPALVAAFDLARRSQTDLELVIAGASGDDTAAVDRAIGRLDSASADAVHRVGRIGDDDKAWLLRHAAALAYPSLDEGFGFPLLEAMSAGTPVVASTAGSIPEVVGTAGLLVDPDDVEGLAAALLRAAFDPPTRARLVAAGYARLKQFTWSTTAARLDDLYAALVMEHDAR